MGKERIILGVDPGTRIHGFGIIKTDGNKVSMIAMDELILIKITDPYLKLKKIFERTIQLIDQYHPDELAIEAQFFGENPQSMLKLGRAQGVTMAAALSRELSVTEYFPTKVKVALCGNGRASKEQIARTVTRLLNVDIPEKYWDSTDALAVALCHYYQKNNISSEDTSKKKYSNWAAYVKDLEKK